MMKENQKIARTDLAIELAQPLLEAEKLPEGLKVHTQTHGAVEITCVQIASPKASQQLQKPCGRYITIQTPPLWNSLLDPQQEIDAAADCIRSLLPQEGTVLVVGLGNSSITPDALGPQVQIMHTHATESFEPYDSEMYDTRHTWRSTDNSENIVAAGEVMAQAIRSHGIEVLHDDTQHDYPSYNGSYERSAETVKEYLAKYPSIKVVLDVHRDAVQRDSTLVKPITQINGKKAAQMMIIAGCDDGTMEMPNWGKNLRFAAGIQDAIESRWKGLTRPIFFCYRKYNQDLTTGSLLLELGSHGNTLEQVLTTAQLAGDAIGNYLAQECMAE